MEKLRVGIIGLGVGERHIEGYRSHPGCEVVSLCDFDDDKYRAAKKKYTSMLVTKDPDRILSDPDIGAVSIASYDNYHYEQVMAAIDNGKHVFVEKPLCLYESQAVSIRKLLRKRRDIRMSSNLILRMSPRFRLLKGLIDKGRMGRLYYVEGDYNYGRIEKIISGWRGRIPFYSVVYGGGVHIIDLLLWLTGDRIVEVSGYGNNISTKDKGFRNYDTVVSILKFKSGMIGKVSSNFACVHPHFHALSLHGTRASFVNGSKEGILYEQSKGGVRKKAIDAAYPGVNKGDLIYSFVDSILNGSTPVVTAEDVFRTMSVCFAMEKSARCRGPVKVRYI